jgi:Zn-dependent alcohol dehydrogenase
MLCDDLLAYQSDIPHQRLTHFLKSATPEQLCEWIRQGKLSLTELLSVEFPISQINEAFTLSRAGETLKTLLGY